jgi:hypothetical protein
VTVPQSPAQAAFVALHLAKGRPDLAAMVLRFPPETFVEMDRAMRAAYLLGAAAAMDPKKD